MASYGLLKGLGSAFNKTADDWGEQLREERIRAYQDKVRQKEWSREDELLEKKQARQQEQAQSQVAEYVTFQGEDGNQYNVGVNLQGDRITDPVLAETSQPSYDHYKVIGDDMIDMRTNEAVYQGGTEKEPNLKTITTVNEDGYEVDQLVEVYQENGRTVQRPVTRAGGGQGGAPGNIEERLKSAELPDTEEERLDGMKVKGGLLQKREYKSPERARVQAEERETQQKHAEMREQAAKERKLESFDNALDNMERHGVKTTIGRGPNTFGMVDDRTEDLLEIIESPLSTPEQKERAKRLFDQSRDAGISYR